MPNEYDAEYEEMIESAIRETEIVERERALAICHEMLIAFPFAPFATISEELRRRILEDE